jgi:hypothetical protein
VAAQSVVGSVEEAQMTRASRMRAQLAALMAFALATLRRGRHHHGPQLAVEQELLPPADQSVLAAQSANHTAVLCIGTDRIRRLPQPLAPCWAVEGAAP